MGIDECTRLEMGIDEQQTSKASRNNFRRSRLCSGLMTILGLTIVVLLCYNTYMVQKLNNSSSPENNNEVLQSPQRLVDPDATDPQHEMSESQKFFLNIGIQQEHEVKGCSDDQLKHSFPNIDYVFLGYDIYKGYPLADSHDPGFTYPIFKADYSKKSQSADCRFSIPNGFISVSDVSCVASFSSTTIVKEEELVKTLSTMTEFGIANEVLSFSASHGYKETTNAITKEKKVFIISTAHCDYYFVKIRKETPPTFDDEFLIWLSKLDSTDSNITYVEFMYKYGTHFLTEATFGARFTNEYKMSSNYFKSITDMVNTASVRASYAGKVSIGAGFTLEKGQRDAASEFIENVQSRTITVGAVPPSNGDALTWASEVQQHPVPVRYKLQPIENLFVEEYVGALGIDYEAIRLNILKHKEAYGRYLIQIDQYDFEGDDDYLVLWKVHDTLSVAGGGRRGAWARHFEMCPKGSFAIGYNLKIEPDQGNGDDTGLNAIKLVCADANGLVQGDPITSTQGIWGKYRKEFEYCPKTIGRTVFFMNQFSLQMDDPSVAASFVKFECQDIDQTKAVEELAIYPGYGEPWGTMWYRSKSCPVGTAICGIKTKVLSPQGGNDDSALNDVKFLCCGWQIKNTD